MKDPLTVAVASAVLGGVIALIGFFIRGYFETRAKKADTTEDDLKKLKDLIHTDLKALSVRVAEAHGKSKERDARMFGEIQVLGTKVDLYMRHVASLEGKVEQNNESLLKAVANMDHVGRQIKRLFEKIEKVEGGLTAQG